MIAALVVIGLLVVAIVLALCYVLMPRKRVDRKPDGSTWISRDRE